MWSKVNSLYQLTIAEVWCRTKGICFSIASHHCSFPDWLDVGSSLVFSALSGSYKGADETFFILTQSEINGASSNLSSKGSSVPLNPDIARRHSSKTWYNWHQRTIAYVHRWEKSLHWPKILLRFCLIFQCKTKRFTQEKLRFFFFFEGGKPKILRDTYFNSSCNDFFPNKSNKISSMPLPRPCRNFRSSCPQKTINHGGNLFPTGTHNTWVIVWNSPKSL